MAEDKNLELAKKANALILNVVKILKDKKASKEDIARFEKVTQGFNDACGMVNGDARSAAFAAGWMVSMANNAAFLLWRRNLMAEEIEAEYRTLPSTEDAMKDYNDFMEADNEEAKKLEAERRVFMDGQHKIDIFKAVLGGTPKAEAEAKLEEYQKRVAQSLGA